MSQHIEQFILDCKMKGLSVTYQRLAVYKSLISEFSHPTVEEIFNKVKIDHPTISLATVYKTLETLAENQLISKVTILHDIARYDSQMNPHHHMVCVRCRKIIDINHEDFNKLSVPKDSIGDFQILNYQVQVNGICGNCTH